MLEPADDERNYIGFRHSWLKMSRPSIEGLRQAFLDHESRIRFGEKRPEDGYLYPKIRQLEVRGAAFLADQVIALSPNLTSIIGGGGTGKSTIIEYLRIALGQEAAIQGKDARRNFEKLRRTISPQTRIEIEIERDGTTWVLQSRGGQPSEVVAGEDIPDLAKLFPVRVLSQREIYAVAEDPVARARLLDNLIRDHLDALDRDAEDVRRDIRHLDEQILDEPNLRARRDQIATERLSLQTKLASLRRLEEPVRVWKGYVAERDFLASVQEEVGQVADAFEGQLQDLELLSTTLGRDLATSLNAALITAVAHDADQAIMALGESIAQAVEAFRANVQERLDRADIRQWHAGFVAAEQAYQRLRKELHAQDADPDLYLQYGKQLRDAESTLQVTEQRIAALKELADQRAKRLVALMQLWEQQTALRKAKATALQAKVPMTVSGSPFVEVEVVAYGDVDAFVDKTESHLADRRRISTDDWRELMEAVVAATPAGTPPTCTLVEWMRALRSGASPEGFPWTAGDRRRSVLVEWFTPAACAAIELVRVPDRVIVRLNRQDGTPAGELEQGLSVGQKCTAILALLLADDDAPAIIDQPEDELDNEFTYRELVPLLRRVKEERQVILSTHDPNLPVNGDAELIYALEARDGRGVVKKVAGEEAVGALDRKAVRVAVEDIMEGSEEAFRRRYDKYGF